MSKRIVFVIGASGNVGKATVNALSANYGGELDIRAGVRKPENVAEYQSLQGVTVVKAEMGKREDLIETFKDVNVLFIVVPGAGNRVELTRVTAEAAKEAGVKHILVLGAPNTTKGAITLAQMLLEIERIIRNLGPSYTFLCLPWFMENFFAFKEPLQKSSMFYTPAEPDKSFLVVCMDDVGLAAATVLYSPEKHAGKSYTLVSDKLKYKDVARAFSHALGKEVKYTQQSYEDARAELSKFGLPIWQLDGLVEYYEMVNAGGEDINPSNDFTALTGQQPTNFTSWLQRYGAAFK